MSTPKGKNLRTDSNTHGRQTNFDRVVVLNFLRVHWELIILLHYLIAAKPSSHCSYRLVASEANLAYDALSATTASLFMLDQV